MPMTTSRDEAVKVHVMPEKWKRGAVGGGGSGAWRSSGDLADVEADAAGVCVYNVPEGQWIDVYMLNRGREEVCMYVSKEQACAYGMTQRSSQPVTLGYQGEAWTGMFCIGGDRGAMDVRFLSRFEDPPLLHLRFVCPSTGANGQPTRV
jgi:hypothetical protein